MDIKEKEPVQAIKIKTDSRYLLFVTFPEHFTLRQIDEQSYLIADRFRKWLESGEQVGILSLYYGVSVRIERIENEPQD